MADNVFTTVKEFSKKHKVPTSTLYYILNRDIVKLRMTKTKYGNRKMFKESEMITECKSRFLFKDTNTAKTPAPVPQTRVTLSQAFKTLSSSGS
jgi:predicted transcriptional regulator